MIKISAATVKAEMVTELSVHYLDVSRLYHVVIPVPWTELTKIAINTFHRPYLPTQFLFNPLFQD